MRLHITLDDELVKELDRRIPRRRRSSFVATAVRRALDDERRWELIESAMGAIPDHGHDWDADPGEWVRQQRRGDPRRIG